MAEIIKLDGTIPEESDGLRLDQALAQLFPDFSRGQLSKWIKAGDVLLNDNVPKPRDKVREGDNVIINAELQVQDEQWLAEKIELDIVYEDDHVLILNKPAGMVVHPGSGNYLYLKYTYNAAQNGAEARGGEATIACRFGEMRSAVGRPQRRWRRRSSRISA